MTTFTKGHHEATISEFQAAFPEFELRTAYGTGLSDYGTISFDIKKDGTVARKYTLNFSEDKSEEVQEAATEPDFLTGITAMFGTNAKERNDAREKLGVSVRDIEVAKRALAR